MHKYQTLLSEILRLEGLAIFPPLRLVETAKTNLRLNFKAGFTVTMFEFNVFLLLFLKFCRDYRNVNGLLCIIEFNSTKLYGIRA